MPVVDPNAKRRNPPDDIFTKAAKDEAKAMQKRMAELKKTTVSDKVKVKRVKKK